MTHPISYAISAILISTIVPLVLGLLAFKASSSKISYSSYTLKYTRFIPMLCLGTIILIAGLIVWALIQNTPFPIGGYIFLGIFYSLFICALVWGFLRGLNFRLILNEDVMIYRNIWGMVRRFDYKDIKEVRPLCNRFKHVEVYRIYVKGLRLWISIDYLTMGFNEFPGIMRKRLKKANNRIEFTKVPPKKK